MMPTYTFQSKNLGLNPEASALEFKRMRMRTREVRDQRDYPPLLQAPAPPASSPQPHTPPLQQQQQQQQQQ